MNWIKEIENEINKYKTILKQYQKERRKAAHLKDKEEHKFLSKQILHFKNSIKNLEYLKEKYTL